MRRKRCSGTTLIECLLSVAVIGIVAFIAVPDIDGMCRRRALALAAEEVRQHLAAAQQRASSMGGNCGVVFAPRGESWTYTIYLDGDGDGVMNADVAGGADRRLEGPLPLLSNPNRISVAIGPGFTDPDTLDPIPEGTRPVGFGRSFICSFSPNGNGTPGSVYLTDNASLGALVRCSGSGGNLRKLFYRGAGRSWVER
jgi:prepilin-type N-terminal cleavage/methylation domain-containing protein